MLPEFVVAIDPGTTESGVCIVRREDYSPIWCAKIGNGEVYSSVCNALRCAGALKGAKDGGCQLVIERMSNHSSASSYVFLTCEWIGRFDVLFDKVFDLPTAYVYRHEEYKALCGREYPHNDRGVKSALVDRFAYGQPNYGKGTKRNPGWFHGFSQDMWSAYAIAVTHIDKE